MPEKHSDSLLRLRLRRFRRLKRGYYSFLFLVGLYFLTFLLPLLMNNRALVVRYDGSYYFPALRTYLHETFGYSPRLGFFEDHAYPPKRFGIDSVSVHTDFRQLQKDWRAADSANFVWMPFIPYGPNEQFLDQEGRPPYGPSRKHWMGTDDRGRDVFVRLAYGFRISITFALMVTTFSYVFGTMVGAVLGYFGSWIDLLGVRLVEIWGAVPFLYTVIILGSMLPRSFLLLVGILAMFEWLAICYYIRGEFYREKAKDYVAAAIACGENNWAIMFRHILPNALTPIIAFAPFALVANISVLVALDFLGFGLPVPTPSWGELIGQGKADFSEWHLVVFPLLAMFLTLQLIVFIGEAVREAFDPKVFSRLR